MIDIEGRVFEELSATKKRKERSRERIYEKMERKGGEE